MFGFVLALAVPMAEAQTRIDLATLPGKLRYDAETLFARPGEKLVLVFENNDEMQHNWVLCQQGASTAMEVAKLAWALGVDATEKQFVPDSPAVLQWTPVVDQGNTVELRFTAPERPGDYPYVCTLPGHAFTMKGTFTVRESVPEIRRVAATADEDTSNERYVLTPHHGPLVKRAFVENGPARSVLVGLPGGINYCFDAETCSLRFGWFGRFLDVGPDWGSPPGHRGGKPVKTLGERFSVGSVDLPIRIGAPYLSPQVEFLGYRWDGMETPEFRYLVDGVPVRHRIDAAEGGIGVRHSIQFHGIHAPVFFLFDEDDVQLSSNVGDWRDGALAVDPDADTVEITVLSQTAISAFE